MGHPHDPEGHSHHNSVWTSHVDVDGVDFWSDKRFGVVRHKHIVSYEDQGEKSSITAENEWVDKDGRILLNETRRISVTLLEDGRFLRSPGQARPGARLTTRLLAGEVSSVVVKNAPAAPAARPGSKERALMIVVADREIGAV